MRLQRVILLGAPGVGKGTYARRIAPLFNLEHVIVGDLVRSHIRSATPIGKQIADAARRGDLADDSVILSLVLEHLKARGLERGGYMLDGVPRTVVQAQAVDRLLRPDLALHLTMDEAVMLEKMTARRLGADDRVYNLAYIKRGGWDMPPLLPEPTRWDPADNQLHCAHGVPLTPNTLVECARCTEGLRTRDDDAIDICRHRLETYKAETAPLIAHYAPIRLDFTIGGGVDQCLPLLLDRLHAHANSHADVPPPPPPPAGESRAKL
jgi:adenylate kinase